ncbi:Esterase/lipase superfamily enzyme [Methylomagnum ishizawai]|uniref:Esterase/lipase superfamily enzyme n=1 Tax=Methylomagnum ishizawai TaxID=1760988 RepID=A0A1Y6D9E6_9GAMM|nr:alpha/beta hydrolase-fold protein [Methylomagnum ishizawai]SMF97012.1 Esterase/lipase superfamily enzyme [Methylomagnum ishizawai]
MNREYHRWHSPRLHRDMELLVFGHAGAKVLVFPTRDGRFYEYENLRIVQSIADKIKDGHLQLYCVEGLADETFYCWWRQPADRIKRYLQYEDYLLHEVLPFMADRNPHPCTISHGCSLGAFYAANFAFRHPHLFQKLSAFSGRYDLTLNIEHFGNLFDGYYDENIYFNTPNHYLPNLECQWRLEALRKMDIILVIGKDDPFLDNNRQLSHILWGKGVWNALHEWDGRAHQGRYWRKMAPLYL